MTKRIETPGLAHSLSVATEAHNRALLQSNLLKKLDLVRACRGLWDLDLNVAWEPVVVCGAGPSLDEALPVLLERKPAVIAAARAVRTLLKAGVVPRAIVEVEVVPEGAESLRGVDGLAQIPLVFDPLCTPATVLEYPGPLYTYERPIDGFPGGNPTAGKGEIPLGTGVIVYAVGLAQLLGADPVILAGVDLAYPAGRHHHARGVNELTTIKEGRSEMEILSTQGEMVPTDRYFAAQVEELSGLFNGNLIQTSPMGAMIPGWRYERLEDVL